MPDGQRFAPKKNSAVLYTCGENLSAAGWHLLWLRMLNFILKASSC